MSKRIATLLLGIGLIVVGALFFVAPEQAFAVRWLMRLWPVALILAGLVRVAGYLLDRHPRSPVGGMMLTTTGGILLSANLLGHNYGQIPGKYWFWILLAFIAGRLLKQYTHRYEDGLRPNAFSAGAVIGMVIIAGAGLAATIVANNQGSGFNLNMRIGDLRVGDYVFGDQIAIEDKSPQSFTLGPNSRLLINNAKGDIEIASAPQLHPTARLIRRIRAGSVEEAREIAKNINLQIIPEGPEGSNGSIGMSYRFNIDAAEVEQDFSVSIIVTLPENLRTGVEINNALGVVKLNGLQGAHVIRGCERAEISRNVGGVTVENPRGAVEFSDIQGPVSLTNTRQAVNLRAINGPITLDVKDGNVRLENSSGPIRLRATDARIGISEVGKNASTPGRVPSTVPTVIDIEQARGSHIKLQEIKGAIEIKAERSRVEAREISGDFRINSSSDRVMVNRIRGDLSIKSRNGAVEVEEVRGRATIEATSDVTVRNFSGPLRIFSRDGAIDLQTSEKLNGDISAVSERGRIRVAIPRDSGFRLEANAGEGRVKTKDGFDDAEWERHDRSYVIGYNITASSPLVSLRSNRGEIQLRSSGLAMTSQNN
jgi:DUF4097 and DUF4098 domain-containing protein YvlB